MKIFRGSAIAAALLVSSSVNLPAQTPSVADGGVLNAASFARGQAVSAGSLVSIFGSNLASGLAQASSVPLSTSLSGVSVSFNNVPAPLLFVSPGQINAQLPWEVTNGNATVVVSRNGSLSAPTTFQVGPVSPGIFAINNQAVAINNDGSIAAPSGSIPGINTHPAVIGDPNGLIILATGLGAVTPPAVTGNNSLDTLRTAQTTPTVLVGGVPAKVQFAGLSPQFVGVNQINVSISPGTPTGNAVPIQLQAGGITTSSTITIAVSQ